MPRDVGTIAKIEDAKRKCIDDEEIKPTKRLNTTRDLSPTVHDSTNTGRTVDRLFFDVACVDLARSLLNCDICRRLKNNEVLRARIVETEAYLGGEDKAAHSYNGKRTERNEPMYMESGTLYVYNIYGMYACMNVSSKGDGCAVLIRAAEPVSGIETMGEFRRSHTKGTKKKLEAHKLCNGPSKLCMALKITKDQLNKKSLHDNHDIWIEHGDHVSDGSIVECPRINIGYAEEWILKSLRFYVKGNRCVSVRDKQAECD